ncbi:DUF721 domain-containing protein [Raineya orbicola]|uniref:DUF721 domain-containing protein n=1 Tax=Raineya orbicola TaxID=2016530 RepID=A0A2N3I6W6_9BACT|nr:DUF721 domain-containing protein [Raineya orbicola]PKQ66027.1 hypothetical protein Rain11_2511 [Raineya orbicola]
MASQKRNSQPYLLKQILESVVSQFPQKNRFDELNIKQIWINVMGKPIAEQTQNIYLKNNILYVKIVSSVLRQELMMHKTKIRNLINEKLNYEMVKEIHFT